MTDVPARYLAGRLRSEEAERFEEHYFECDRCAHELEVGTAIRRSVAAPVSGKRFPLLGIAAAIAVVTASALFLARPRSVEERAEMRGVAATAIEVTTTTSGDSLTIRWSRVPAAASYVVILFDDKGTVLQRSAVSGTSLTTAIPSRGRLFVRVEAVDRSRRAIGTSSLQRIETSK